MSGSISEVLYKKDWPPLIHIDPDASLFEAIQMLCSNKVHRLPIISKLGNPLYVLTHKRILRFLFIYVSMIIVYNNPILKNNKFPTFFMRNTRIHVL